MSLNFRINKIAMFNDLPFIVHQPAQDVEEVPDFVLSHDQDEGTSLDNANQRSR